jgi:hypothetical protein
MLDGSGLALALAMFRLGAASSDFAQPTAHQHPHYIPNTIQRAPNMYGQSPGALKSST